MSAFTKSLTAMNSFTFEIADAYFKTKGRLLKQREKGYKYFAEGYVHDLWVSTVIEKLFVVKAKCFKSQKKNDVPHNLNMEFVGDNLQIKCCCCSCEAGASESCQHLIALAYTLQHLVLKGFSEIPEDLSCTSITQQWSIPRGQKINPEPLMNVAFVNALNTNRQKNPVFCDLYEARTPSMRKMESATIEAVKSQLAKVDARIPFAYLLSSDTRENEISCVNEGITKESAIFYHLKNYEAPTIHSEVDDVERIKFPIITSDVNKILTSKSFIVPDKVKKSLDECYSTEQLTRDQASSAIWKSEKQLRFAASNFGLLSKRKKAPTEKFISSILNGKDVSYLPAIKHGVNTEEVARLKYIKEKKTVQVYRCGLVINPLAPYLGASPDGHVVDSALAENRNGVLEIKCPHSRKFRSLKEALNSKDFYCEKTNKIKLKQSANYFYQVQGQMLLSGVNWCDFVVYFSETDEIIIDRIEFDFDFCLAMFSKLAIMYSSYVIPFIADENKENKP